MITQNIFAWLDTLHPGIRLLILLGVLFAIYVIQRFVQFFIIRSIKKTEKISVSADMENGIRLLVRLTAYIIMLNAIIIIYELPPDIAVALSTFFGAVVSFGSVQAVQNFVAGVYVLLTRPFGIGDLIRVAGYEGQVSVIALNYTKVRTFDNTFVLIPNKSIMGSNIINFNRKLERETIDIDEMRDIRAISDFIFDEEEEVVRYTMKLAIPIGDMNSIKTELDKVCTKYIPNFGKKPTYSLIGIDAHLQFNFVITTEDVNTIFEYGSPFVRDINAKFR